MSESKKQTKSTSTFKMTDEEKKKSESSTSNTCLPRNDCHQKRYERQSGQKRVGITSNFSNDSDINSYNFNNSHSVHNYSEASIPFNSYPSYQPLYYQMNGQMYYQTYRPVYYQPYSPTFNYPNYSLPQTMNSQSNHSNNDQLSDRVMRFRKMFRTKGSEESASNEFRFSIMTYNILSQNLMEDHSSLYQHCSPSALKWPQRGQRILKELLESNCDIFCLQEVHCQHFDEVFKPALKQSGYDSVFKQRTGGKMDGCAVVFKENKFSLIDEIKLDYMRKDLSSLLDRDNIAIIVKLKPKDWSRDSNLIVANTHLLYNPKRGDVKLAQIRLLMAEIDKIAKISSKEDILDHNPIILCGDFNSEPNSPLFNFITNGSANFDGHKIGDISGQREGYGRGRLMEDHHLRLLGVTSDTRFDDSSDNETDGEKMSIQHNFKLKSVVFRFENKMGHKLISTSNRFDSGLVDYIFYDYNKLKLRAFQRLLTEKELPQIGYIPNNVLGSDHLSIKAIFSII